MTTDQWLKRLAPGALLFLKSWPHGFWLVYHAEVEQFPGPWTQLKVWLVDPRCKLSRIEIESGEFGERWDIVDVNE